MKDDRELLSRLAPMVVNLDGPDGNAFSILSTASSIIRRYLGVEQSKRYIAEATTADYRHLLMVTECWLPAKWYQCGQLKFDSSDVDCPTGIAEVKEAATRANTEHT